jgi:hypothetical protein
MNLRVYQRRIYRTAMVIPGEQEESKRESTGKCRYTMRW